MAMKNKIRDTILKRSSFIILLLLILSGFSLLRMLATHQDIDDVARIDLPLVEVLTKNRNFAIRAIYQF